MNESEILERLISLPGQSQNDRSLPALATDFVAVDERKPRDFLEFARKLAAEIQFFPATVDGRAELEPSVRATWEGFFPDEAEMDELLTRGDGSVPPHLALFLAFLELYREPQRLLNRFTGAHLDFQYRRVLQLTERPAIPGRAHLVVELKPNTAPLLITPAMLFSAKDPDGVELVYRPVGQTLVSQARIGSLHSQCVDASDGGCVRFAPNPQSTDGFGRAPAIPGSAWAAFASDSWPRARIGFALAAPILRMKEGLRSVKVTLTLAPGSVAPSAGQSMADLFEVALTGEGGWFEAGLVTPEWEAAGALSLRFDIAASAPGIIDYNARVHGGEYGAVAPVLLAAFNQNQRGLGYDLLKQWVILSAKISVCVQGVTSLTVESDQGALDPTSAFAPFGAQPTQGARFYVSYDEAFAKNFNELDLTVTWKGAPKDLGALYANYGVEGITNTYFLASLALMDWRGASIAETEAPLFDQANAQADRHFRLAPTAAPVPSEISPQSRYATLMSSGRRWGRKEAEALSLRHPSISARGAQAPSARPGYLTLTLKNEDGFLHATYRRRQIEAIVNYARSAVEKSAGASAPQLLAEPYTPTIQHLSLKYSAATDPVDITLIDQPAAEAEKAFFNPDIQFFQVGCFGQMRDHTYQRQILTFPEDKQVPLLPTCLPGEFHLGLTGVEPGGGVTILFQVAEGSADPALPPTPLSWSVLCDNYWRPLKSEEMIREATGGLRQSGLITLAIPTEATTDNTILPPNHLWLRATLTGRADGVCKLVDVLANAIEARFEPAVGAASAGGAATLAGGTPVRPKTGGAAIKSVTQPFASFGQRPVEPAPAFHARVAERLRHKNRCITAWDYERIILEAFPEVHRVKCIPHARDDSRLAPGNVLLVVVPKLATPPGPSLAGPVQDPPEPRIEAGILSRIEDFVRQRCGMGVKVRVKNPLYQVVQLDFKAGFYSNRSFPAGADHYLNQLRADLTRVLSPWAFDASSELSFGGKIFKSLLLDFTYQLPYVETIEDFKMYSYPKGRKNTIDLAVAVPSTPDALLISGPHAIEIARPT